MKKTYLTLILIFSLYTLYSQNFQWAKIEGHYAYDYGYGIATDAAGSVYVAGKYEENAVFSGTTLPLQGNHDIFLAKYAPNGSLDWVQTGGSYSGDYARILACNKTSRVYIAGEIEGLNNTIVFPGSPITLTGQGLNDIFLATYDLNGNLLWARSEGAACNEKALGVTYDAAGNVIICGYYTDTTKFNGVVLNSTNDKDIFIAKYDANGNFLWMRHAGGPGEEEAKSVVCDAGGNIYICGKYSDGATFGTTTFSTPVTPYGQFYNGYIAKYSPSGSLIWVKSIDGDYDDIAWSMTKDDNDKLYVTGEFSGATFGGITLYSGGKADVFVACYDNNGNAQWAVSGGSVVADRARGIGCDGSNIFITGQFGLTATFGGSTITAADSSDIFVAELNNSGNFLWAKSVGGVADSLEVDGYESGIAVCADPSGTAYVTGAILEGGMFGSNFVNGYSRTDVFIAKMSTVVDVSEASRNTDVLVYPNPGTGIFNITTEKGFDDHTSISVYNYLGELVSESLVPTATRQVQMNLTDNTKGIYYMEIRSDKDVIIKKLLLQ